MNSKVIDLAVLDTVTANGTDCSVSGGIVTLKDIDGPILTSGLISVETKTAVTAVAKVDIVTPSTVSNNAVYSLTLTYTDSKTGLSVAKPMTYTSDASASATEICNAFRSYINSTPNCPVTASGTTTLILTADSGYPNSFVTSTSDSKFTIATGGSGGSTAGVVGYGLGSQLAAKYPEAEYPAIANLVAASAYTEVIVTYQDLAGQGENSTMSNGIVSAVMLVKESATNFADLLGTYGTVTGLRAGYAVTITAPATTTCEVTVTTGALTLAGGSATFASLGAQSGDYIAIGSDVTKITGITGAAAGFGTKVTATAAATFKLAAWRNLGL